MSESFELKKKRPSCAPSKSPTALLEGRKRGEPGHDKMGIDRSEGNGDNVQTAKDTEPLSQHFGHGQLNSMVNIIITIVKNLRVIMCAIGRFREGVLVWPGVWGDLGT